MPARKTATPEWPTRRGRTWKHHLQNSMYTLKQNRPEFRGATMPFLSAQAIRGCESSSGESNTFLCGPPRRIPHNTRSHPDVYEVPSLDCSCEWRLPSEHRRLRTRMFHSPPPVRVLRSPLPSKISDDAVLVVQVSLQGHLVL